MPSDREAPLPVAGSFWYCSCRHPKTRVYYADTLEDARTERDALRADRTALIEALAAQIYNWAGIEAHRKRMAEDPTAAIARLFEDVNYDK